MTGKDSRSARYVPETKQKLSLKIPSTESMNEMEIYQEPAKKQPEEHPPQHVILMNDEGSKVSHADGASSVSTLRFLTGSLFPFHDVPMATQSATLPRWICAFSVPYAFATLAAVLAPEMLIAGLWIAGIRSEHIGNSYMWPANCGWWILLAYSFSLIFGWAFVFGLAIRSAVATWYSDLKSATAGWIIVLVSTVSYVAHLRGYVGWVHLMNV